MWPRRSILTMPLNMIPQGTLHSFLVFGRHPRLAVDACLGLQNPTEPISSREHYASKLKKRFDFAYKVAAREAKKSADRNKTNYDLKVREATLDVGDHVLIRNVGLS